MPQWFEIADTSALDSPSLLIYKERVQHNIAQTIALAGSPERLFVHVKTNKMPAVVQMMVAKGITSFKCATIAEAEMTAANGGRQVVIAHQLVGPKMQRLLQLTEKFPDTVFYSLVDNLPTAQALAQIFRAAGKTARTLLDINNGMNRSGHLPDNEAIELYRQINRTAGICCEGIHAYDGHIRDADFQTRKEKIDNGFLSVEEIIRRLEQTGEKVPILIAGGTPAYTAHRLREGVYCSPGTCVLWDWGYGDTLTEQPFQYAALVLTRIISKPAPGLLAVDMGHKAIAAENPIDKRIRFLNLTDYELISQSEEHGVVRVADWDKWKVGDVLYGVPYHVCPTVNLYDEAYCIEDGQMTAVWEITARRRRLSI
jgi:D-serine deaminase-like pyridoxal phosphate-dependent protein